MEFVGWGLNLFLGSVFSLAVFHNRYLHDSITQNRLDSGAFIAFLTFTLISLVLLLREMLAGATRFFLPIAGYELSLVILAMSLPLLSIMKHIMRVSYTVSGVFLVMMGVKVTGSPFFMLAPVICTFGVLLQYFGYTVSLKKLNQ